jgi:hypothetical protein
MLHHLGILTKYDARAARDDLVDNFLEDWFEFPVRQRNLAFVDPQAREVIRVSTKFEAIFFHDAVKFWFKLPGIVNTGPKLKVVDSPPSQRRPPYS